MNADDHGIRYRIVLLVGPMLSIGLFVAHSSFAVLRTECGKHINDGCRSSAGKTILLIFINDFICMFSICVLFGGCKK